MKRYDYETGIPMEDLVGIPPEAVPELLIRHGAGIVFQTQDADMAWKRYCWLRQIGADAMCIRAHDTNALGLEMAYFVADPRTMFAFLRIMAGETLSPRWVTPELLTTPLGRMIKERLKLTGTKVPEGGRYVMITQNAEMVHLKEEDEVTSVELWWLNPEKKQREKAGPLRTLGRWARRLFWRRRLRRLAKGASERKIGGTGSAD